MESKKIAILIGTRPGIIKMSTLIHELERRDVNHIVIHTGQHYSENMDRIIMDNVGIKKIHYHIKRKESWITHAQQTAYMLTALEDILLREKVDLILVCGDANTNLAGALAARKIHVKVGHVEAGLRSFDWRMPEEHNRVIIDHISEYLFAPTTQAKEYLLNDGVRGKIFVVGNTIVDATTQYIEKARKEYQKRVKEVTLGNQYILLTLHREENVDNYEVLINIVEAIMLICEIFRYNIIFPVHPRTMKRIKEFGLLNKLSSIKKLKLIPPLSYLEFLGFLSYSSIVMTDSGGVQEESCILKVPCLTLRNSTERHETTRIGANLVAGTRKDKILKAFNQIYSSIDTFNDWKNPYGDGKTSKRIIDTCLKGRPEDEFYDG